MTDPGPDSVSDAGSDGGAPGAEGSSFGQLFEVLVAPAKTFAALAKRPRFLVALLTVVAVATASVYLSMKKIDPDQLVREIESQGKELPQELHDNPERLASFTLWSATIWTPIAIAGFLLLEALVFMVVFRMLGSEIDFRRSAATTAYAGMPLVVSALVGVAVVLGREHVGLLELQSGQLVASNLGFLADEGTSKAMRALLGSFDLFAAWCVALTALGYRIVARVTSGMAWTVVLILWAVGISLKVGLAAAF